MRKLGQYIRAPLTVMCSCFGWPIFIHNWVYIFPRIEFAIYDLTFYILKRFRGIVLAWAKMFVCFKVIF